MNASQILILPGWQNSGAATLAKPVGTSIYGYQRVEQHDWMRPSAWRLDRPSGRRGAVGCVPGCAGSTQPRLLVGGRVGQLFKTYSSRARPPCWWRRGCGASRTPPLLPSWSPIPLLQGVAIPSVLYGSHNDPYCSLDRARQIRFCLGCPLHRLRCTVATSMPSPI
jgi:hypothetical protein